MAENLHQPFSSDEGEIIFQSDAVLKEETKDDILWESSFTNDLTAENDEIDAPAEFKRSKDKGVEKFWKTRFSHKKSTFGTSSLRTVLDRPTHYGWDMADAAVKWQVHNDHGQRHGRVRLNTTLGCFVSTPGVGQYDPNDNLHKRRVRTSRLVSRLDEPRKDYTTPAPNAHNIIRTMDPSHIQKQMIGSEWKEGLTFTKSFENPGPGTHETPLVSSKHERFPVARLATRSPHRPRTTLAPDLTVLDKYDVDVCDPVGDRWENPPPGQYEVSVDIGKSRKARTIGERQPLLEQKEILKPGPQCYDAERSNRFGVGESMISKPSPMLSRLKPLVNPSADPDNMTTKINKGVWAKYSSDYSFPKPVYARVVKGRVFHSTVQDMPQHHLGKHSQGAHMKT